MRRSDFKTALHEILIFLQRRICRFFNFFISITIDFFVTNSVMFILILPCHTNKFFVFPMLSLKNRIYGLNDVLHIPSYALTTTPNSMKALENSNWKITIEPHNVLDFSCSSMIIFISGNTTFRMLYFHHNFNWRIWEHNNISISKTNNTKRILFPLFIDKPINLYLEKLMWTVPYKQMGQTIQMTNGKGSRL